MRIVVSVRDCLLVAVACIGALALLAGPARSALLRLPQDPPDGSSNSAPPPSTIEDLEKRISDPDAAVRDLAAGDLVRRPEARDYIRKMLTAPVDPAREPAVISILQAIRVLGSTQYLPDVLDLTVRNPGNGVREAARATVRDMRGRPEASATLIRVFRDSVDDPERRRKAVEFLEEYRCLRCIPSLIEVGSGTPRPSPMVQEAIVHALATITGEDHGNDWEKWNEWRDRVLVSNEAGEVDWTRVQAHVNETLRGKMLQLRRRVIELTTMNLDQVKLNDTAAYKEEVIRLLRESPYAEIRADAATRIGGLQDLGDGAAAAVASEEVEVLLSAVDDPDSAVTAAAVRSLGKVGATARPEDEGWSVVQERIRSAILPSIHSEFAEVRRNAVDAAGRIGGDEASAALLQLLEELIASSWRDGRLREAVLRALGEPGCASPVSIPVLARVLAEDPIPLNRERAADTMGRIRHDSAIGPLSKAVREDAELTVRWAAVRSLVRIGGDEALAVITEGLADERIRQRCASALGDLGRPEAATALISTLRSEEEEKTRITVIESLGKIRNPAAVDPLLDALEHGETAVSAASEKALTAIWDDDPDLLVRGGGKLVDIAARKPDHAAFAVRTLEHADDLLRPREPGDVLKVRARLNLAAAYYLDAKIPQAEAIYQNLYSLRNQLGRAMACDIEIGLQLCRAAKKPFEAYEALKSAAGADFDPGTEFYWRIVATAARIMVDTAAAVGEDSIERRDAFSRAQAIFTLNERPETLPPELIERLDRLAEIVREGLLEASVSPVRAEEERIKDVILRLGSEVTQEDPEALSQALAEIVEIPLDRSVPCILGYLEDKNPVMRQHAFQLLTGLFAEEKFEFDPAVEDPAARQKAVAAIRDWWAKHPKNPGNQGN